MRVPTNPGTPCPGLDICGLKNVCDGSGSCVRNPLCECPGLDDGNPCTIDMCNGDAAIHSPEVDGTPCNSGDACTTLGVCQTGLCITPPPIVCSNAGEVCLQGACAKTCNSPLGRMISTGQAVHSIVTTDMDGDGATDLIMAGFGGIHLRHGFAFDVNHFVVMGSYYSNLIVADIDGNNKLDLVSSKSLGDSMESYLVTNLNQGNDTFAPSVILASGVGAFSTVARDFNGDGKVDLAAAFGAGIGVFLNKGDGMFAPEVDYAPEAPAAFVMAEDLNGDGNIDIAAAIPMLDEIVLLFNDGNGAFGGPVKIALTNSPTSLAMGDLNGDGKLDLAVGNGGISVFLNDGTGAFTLANEFAAGLVPVSMATADLNGDGALDLATVNASPPSMTTLLNMGTGTFGTPNFFMLGNLPVDIVAADLNGDAKSDIAVVDEDEAVLRLVFNSCMQ